MPEHARVARSTAPVYPRRVSGPSRRLAPAGTASIPRGRTGAFERLSRLPDHRVVDRLLRGRACILLIGLMLGGIVAMQVSLLRLNTGISRAVQTQETLVRQNATLQAAIAEGTSGEKIAAAAASLNIVEPPAGETRYLTARPDKDARRAVKRMKPPSERAQAIMANNGIVPGYLAEPGSAASALAAQLNGEPVPTPVPGATTAPVATPVPGTTAPAATPVPGTPAATPTPIPTATPIPTTAPPVTTDPATGAVAAPQG